EGVRTMINPSLPLPGGDRIVRIRNWDVAANHAESRVLYDFTIWRSALRSITDLCAYRDVSRNLILGPDDSRLVEVAEITASAFRITHARPLLGRVLLERDELAGAPPVVLIGYDVWRTRFAGDRNAIGQTVQIDDAFATVIGVMPEGFAFPVAHELWMPLRVSAFERAPRAGPYVTV